jgi:hypothetical protein
MAIQSSYGVSQAAKPGTLPYFASFGNLSKGPPNATPWDALKDIGLEAVGIVILAVIAGLGPSGANFSIGFLLVLWLLAIVAHPAKA